MSGPPALIVTSLTSRPKKAKMGFFYHHLDDPDVRAAATAIWSEENEALVSDGLRQDCYGSDLIPAGWAAWEAAMPEALAEHNDDWLREQMLDSAYWREARPPTKPGYKPSPVHPKWVSKMLCYSEFNVAYIRGLATTLLAQGETECIVYRADTAAEARCECTAWEGRKFPLQQVLDGHRGRYWPKDSADPDVFSIPSGVNCHHSIHALAAL